MEQQLLSKQTPECPQNTYCFQITFNIKLEALIFFIIFLLLLHMEQILINSLTTLSVDKTEVILKRSHLFNEQSIQKTISILSKVHQGNIFVKQEEDAELHPDKIIIIAQITLNNGTSYRQQLFCGQYEPNIISFIANSHLSKIYSHQHHIGVPFKLSTTPLIPEGFNKNKVPSKVKNFIRNHPHNQNIKKKSFNQEQSVDSTERKTFYRKEKVIQNSSRTKSTHGRRCYCCSGQKQNSITSFKGIFLRSPKKQNFSKHLSRNYVNIHSKEEVTSQESKLIPFKKRQNAGITQRVNVPSFQPYMQKHQQSKTQRPPKNNHSSYRLKGLEKFKGQNYPQVQDFQNFIETKRQNQGQKVNKEKINFRVKHRETASERIKQKQSLYIPLAKKNQKIKQQIIKKEEDEVQMNKQIKKEEKQFEQELPFTVELKTVPNEPKRFVNRVEIQQRYSQMSAPLCYQKLNFNTQISQPEENNYIEAYQKISSCQPIQEQKEKSFFRKSKGNKIKSKEKLSIQSKKQIKPVTFSISQNDCNKSRIECSSKKSISSNKFTSKEFIGNQKIGVINPGTTRIKKMTVKQQKQKFQNYQRNNFHPKVEQKKNSENRQSEREQDIEFHQICHRLNNESGKVSSQIEKQQQTVKKKALKQTNSQTKMQKEVCLSNNLEKYEQKRSQFQQIDQLLAMQNEEEVPVQEETVLYLGKDQSEHSDKKKIIEEEAFHSERQIQNTFTQVKTLKDIESHSDFSSLKSSLNQDLLLEESSILIEEEKHKNQIIESLQKKHQLICRQSLSKSSMENQNLMNNSQINIKPLDHENVIIFQQHLGTSKVKSVSKQTLKKQTLDKQNIEILKNQVKDSSTSEKQLNSSQEQSQQLQSQNKSENKEISLTEQKPFVQNCSQIQIKMFATEQITNIKSNKENSQFNLIGKTPIQKEEQKIVQIVNEQKSLPENSKKLISEHAEKENISMKKIQNISNISDQKVFELKNSQKIEQEQKYEQALQNRPKSYYQIQNGPVMFERKENDSQIFEQKSNKQKQICLNMQNNSNASSSEKSKYKKIVNKDYNILYRETNYQNRNKQDSKQNENMENNEKVSEQSLFEQQTHSQKIQSSKSEKNIQNNSIFPKEKKKTNETQVDLRQIPIQCVQVGTSVNFSLKKAPILKKQMNSVFVQTNQILNLCQDKDLSCKSILVRENISESDLKKEENRCITKNKLLTCSPQFVNVDENSSLTFAQNSFEKITQSSISRKCSLSRQYHEQGDAQSKSEKNIAKKSILPLMNINTSRHSCSKMVETSKFSSEKEQSFSPQGSEHSFEQQSIEYEKKKSCFRHITEKDDEDEYSESIHFSQNNQQLIETPSQKQKQKIKDEEKEDNEQLSEKQNESIQCELRNNKEQSQNLNQISANSLPPILNKIHKTVEQRQFKFNESKEKDKQLIIKNTLNHLCSINPACLEYLQNQQRTKICLFVNGEWTLFTFDQPFVLQDILESIIISQGKTYSQTTVYDVLQMLTALPLRTLSDKDKKGSNKRLLRSIEHLLKNSQNCQQYETSSFGITKIVKNIVTLSKIRHFIDQNKKHQTILQCYSIESKKQEQSYPEKYNFDGESIEEFTSFSILRNPHFLFLQLTSKINTFQMELPPCVLYLQFHSKIILYEETNKNEFSLVKQTHSFFKHSTEKQLTKLLLIIQPQLLEQSSQQIMMRVGLKEGSEEHKMIKIVKQEETIRATNHSGGYQSKSNFYLPVERQLYETKNKSILF